MVVGYVLTNGGMSKDFIKAMIDGYRRTGLSYELVAETGRDLDGTDLRLETLPSSLLNEALILAHGRIIGASRDIEPIQIFSFNGYDFKQLWAAPEPRMLPSFDVARDKITITYHRDTDYERLFRDEIALTPSGPVVSTTELVPPAVK